MAEIERMSLKEARDAYRAKTGHCKHCDFCVTYPTGYFCQVTLETTPLFRDPKPCEYYQPREAK